MASGRLSFWIEPADPRRNLQLLRAVFWFVTACAGFLQAWASRFWISPDGNNYLDIASAYLRGDWNHAVNAYWSPLFSWLLALCLWLFRPSPYWESTLLHLLNFGGLLLALRSFEFFFRAFLRMQKLYSQAAGAEESLSDLGWWTLGYGIFLSTSLFVQSVVSTTPDMWVGVFTYLVVGLLLRIWTQGGGWGLFAALGFALGCAYLTKAFYFPMSFIFLPTAWLATGNPRKMIKQAAFGFVVFALIAGPWAAALSRAKNRITFGDVGKLAFAMTIDQISQPFFWQGENGTGSPKHPVRQLLSKPRLYEFGTPVGGTYPPAYDASYWMEGMRPHFDLRGLLKVLRQSAGTFFQIWMMQIEYGLALLFFFLLAWSKPGWLVLLRRQSFLWVPPLIACSNYAIVLVEHRYVAPFVLLLWVAGFSCLLESALEIPRRVALALILAVLAVTGLRVAKSMSSDLAAILAKPENVNWQAAEGLRVLGLQPGDKIAGLSLTAEVHWARLAGVKIVSEIPLGDGTIFWTSDPEAKRKVFQVLAGTGARVVVTKDPPLSAAREGWIPLARTGFYAYRLP
jgi:4-amino-4-deoxy-L-arabinose transferase-like glycosyltransferase